MPKYSRKDKIVLQDSNNEKNTATVIITVEGNHLHQSFDTLLVEFNNRIKSVLANYKEKEPEIKEPKPQKKKKGFGVSGFYV